MFAPITKWQARVNPANAWSVTDRAVGVAMRPRRGPVFLEIPSDVPSQETPSHGKPEADALSAATADAGSLRAAQALLRDSRRPVLLAGLDALGDDVVAPLRRLVEGWAIPTIMSPKAKGLLRDDDPLSIGTIQGL